MHGFGEFFGQRDIFWRFDSAADRNQNRRGGEVNGLLGLAEKLERLGANLFGLQFHGHGFYRGFSAGVFRCQVSAKRAGLERSKPRAFSGKDHVGGGAALKHLAHENQFAVLVAIINAIADHSFVHRRGKFRRKVADLIGVREQNQVGLDRLDDLL